MIFQARMYDTEEEAAIAFARLQAIEVKMSPQFRMLAHFVLNDQEMIVLGHRKKDKEVKRIKEGHWVGGRVYVPSPEEKQLLTNVADKMREDTEPGVRNVKSWSPNELGLADEEGNIK